MTLREQVWIALLLVAAALTIAAGYRAYFPGDLALIRWVQSLAPASAAWAQWISATGKSPWSLLLVTMTVIISWTVAGLRGALLALASFAGMKLLGQYLGPLAARPRPAPELVRVTGGLSGYSFPSVHALVYASTFGFLAVLFAVKTTGLPRLAAVSFCVAWLLLGFAARLVLGAHWPSDLLLSSLIGLLWAAFLINKLNPSHLF
jgi:membrane-associated phospholipid phosphatase